MSDIFDHELDAWEHWDYDYSEGWYCNDFEYREPDPDNTYYHRKVKIKSVCQDTKKAYRFELESGTKVWVPKALCRKLKKDSVYIWDKFELGGF